MATLRRSLSSFGGFADGVLVRGMPLLTLYPGNVYWVDSGGGGGSKGTFAHPVATIDAALALCTDDNGDIIAIKPGHAETLTAAQAIDKSGVAIVGLGVGSNRPTFTGTGATDDFNVTSNDVTIYNLVFTHTTANGTGMINIGATYCTVSNCRFNQAANSLEGIVIEFDSNDTTIEDCEWHISADGPDRAINIEKSTTSSPARIKILRNYFNGLSTAGSWDAGAIESSGVATNILIQGNIFNFLAASKGGVELTANTTGMIADNYFGAGTIDEMLDPGACSCVENYHTDTTNETAGHFPVASAT